jgi:hypothetical protein
MKNFGPCGQALFGLAQDCNTDEVGSPLVLTCIVKRVIPAALTLSHVILCRALMLA